MEFHSAFLVTSKLPQNHSGDYRGLPVIIEWPKGSVREGTDKDGKRWRREMQADYGYIDDTSAKGDREPLDVYIGKDRKSDRVFVIEQLDEDGDFDEYKLVMGIPDLESAQALYLAHYPEGWAKNRLGEVYEVPFSDFAIAVDEHQEGREESKAASHDEAIDQMRADAETHAHSLIGRVMHRLEELGYMHDRSGGYTCRKCDMRLTGPQEAMGHHQAHHANVGHAYTAALAAMQ